MKLDVFLLGGGSILTCLMFWAFVDRSASVYTISYFAFGLAFLVNHPHFLSSYLLLYSDSAHLVFKRMSYFWAAILAPLLLATVIGYSLIRHDRVALGHVITAMFFFVGWHYVKQIFGCIIVTSVHKRVFYKKWERRLLLSNLYSVWMMSWIRSHVGKSSFEFYGISHSSLGFPEWTLTLIYLAVGVSTVLVIGMHLHKYVEEGKTPAAGGIAAHLALYAWYLPVMAHPGFAYFIPFFHSLQYLAFVALLKRNQVLSESQSLEDEKQRRLSLVLRLGGFASAAFVSGALAFEFIPNGLDTLGWIPREALGASPFLASFILFINIHHYFIDNVIWRSDNELVREHLFSARLPQQQKQEPHSTRIAA